MLELIIIYALNKSEFTLYSLRMYIKKHFGEISSPSHGSLHPALKRLSDKGFINIRKKISDGGKLYSYYSLKNDYTKYFREKFLDISFSKKEPLETFLTEIKIRIIVSILADEVTLSEFREKSELKLTYYKDSIETKLDDKYLELEDIQKSILKLELEQIEKYSSLIKELK